MTKEERRVYMREYRKANKDKIKDYHRKYYQANKEKSKQYTQAWKDKDPEAFALLHRKYSAKYRENNREKCRVAGQRWRDANLDYLREKHLGYREDLHDNYVKAKIAAGTLLSSKDIPQSLIDAKREHLKIKRFLKEQENEQKEA